MANMRHGILLLAIMATTSKGQLVPCSTATLSFAVTVDGSASVDANQFQQQKDFIKRLITRIDVSGNSNAGLVQFASTSQIHIKCNDAATSSAFNTLVDGVNIMTGATCIKCGLDKAQELLSGNGCGRTGENKIIFLMVDGDENIFPNQVVTTASNLRNAGYVIYALAIGNIVDATKIALLTGSADRVFRSRFADLATYDIETLYAALTSTFCTVSQTGWSNWGQWSSCSNTCDPVGVTPSRSRTRSCPSGATCPGSNTESERCNENVLCPVIQWTNWGQWSACSATCNPVSSNPSRTRTRSCSGGSTCPGSATESGSCNINVACPGTLTPWSPYGACSATCQLGLQAPTQQRTRTCVGATLGGNCNSALLVQNTDCNVEVLCPGRLTQWAIWSACSETCQSNINVAPTRSRTRQCVDTSFGGNCGAASLTMTETCNVGVGCSGVWSNWGTYSTCSETCQSNVNAAPTQLRRRTCTGGSCPGSSEDTRNCNVGVSCQGALTQWSAYGACSASCQLGLQAPTQQRTRSCVGATFGGNCNGAVLVQNTDCNVEVLCPGRLTQWAIWSACSETCQSNINVAPTRSRTRQCVDTSFGGNCGGASLTMTETCNVGVGCSVWSNWGQWSSCSVTCNPDGFTPSRTRTRSCSGSSNCPGSSSESESCNVNVACPGVLTLWGQWSGCSATCRAIGGNAPTRTRSRRCDNPSLGGNCGGVSLTETGNCNDASCPVWANWGQWSACSATCNPVGFTPSRTRTRSCSGGSTCPGSASESESCNVNVACPVCIWNQWNQWSTCSKTCDMGARSRSRTCNNPFLANGCNGCVGSSAGTSTCKIADCPVACPVQKRCNCSLTPQFPTTAPALGYFNIDDATIHAAINTLTYWTKEIQNQICESCNLQRLQVSVNTVNSHVTQVKAMIDRLNEIKKRLRDIINCNNNVFIGSELWALYDYLYTRCTMLNGVHTELSACKMRFEAANNSCKKYGWFHQLMRQIYRKW